MGGIYYHAKTCERAAASGHISPANQYSQIRNIDGVWGNRAETCERAAAFRTLYPFVTYTI